MNNFILFILQSVRIIFFIVKGIAGVCHLLYRNRQISVAALKMGGDASGCHFRLPVFLKGGVPDSPAHKVKLALEFTKEFTGPLVPELLGGLSQFPAV